MTDTILISQPGKLEGNKLRVGKIVPVPVDPERPDGPMKASIEFGRICLKLGNGVTAVSEANGMVTLEVTAEAAKRLRWPHPANEAGKPANLDKLRSIVGNQAFGQQEQRDALRQIRAIDPELADRLVHSAWNSWLRDVGVA